MPQPKSSPAEVSMPTFATLEEWTSSLPAPGPVGCARGHRNGYGKLRKLSLTSGTIEVKRPRVRGLDERFESAILPLFARRTQEVGSAIAGAVLARSVPG